MPLRITAINGREFTVQGTWEGGALSATFVVPRCPVEMGVNGVREHIREYAAAVLRGLRQVEQAKPVTIPPGVSATIGVDFAE